MQLSRIAAFAACSACQSHSKFSISRHTAPYGLITTRSPHRGPGFAAQDTTRPALQGQRSPNWWSEIISDHLTVDPSLPATSPSRVLRSHRQRLPASLSLPQAATSIGSSSPRGSTHSDLRGPSHPDPSSSTHARLSFPPSDGSIQRLHPHHNGRSDLQ